MKKIYISILVILMLSFGHAQGYEFGIIHNTGYNFSVVAIPDFNATNTDISDVGFALMLPTGNFDVANVNMFNGRTWSTNEVTASQLTLSGLGDGTRDLFLLNMPPGQTILSHTNGQQIVLASFDITNSPTFGAIEILPNTDAIAIGLGGAVDSFYNSNIDATTTQNYFSGLASGLESFMFSTLSLENIDVIDKEISIVPNPVKNILNIKTNLIFTKMELFDILGKRVLVNAYQESLNVSHLKAGIYILKVQGLNKEVTKKIIIN